MSIRKKRFIRLGFVCLFLGTVEADIITNQASIAPTVWPPYEDLLTSGTGAGLGISIKDLSGGNYNFEHGLIFGEFRFYEATLNMEVRPLYVDTTAPTISNYGGPFLSQQSFLLGETKHYAFWEEIDGIGEGNPDATDNYGWVSLTYDGSDLVVTDSATALGGGIIVGTYTQIPEPATVLLFGLGGLGVWLSRRNKQSRDI